MIRYSAGCWLDQGWALKAVGLSAQGAFPGLSAQSQGLERSRCLMASCWLGLVQHCLGWFELFRLLEVVFGWFWSSSSQTHKFRVIMIGPFHHRKCSSASWVQNWGVYSCPSWMGLDAIDLVWVTSKIKTAQLVPRNALQAEKNDLNEHKALKMI